MILFINYLIFVKEKIVFEYCQKKNCCRYTIGLFIKGYRKNLDVEDIYNPLTQDKSQLLGGRLQW